MHSRNAAARPSALGHWTAFLRHLQRTVWEGGLEDLMTLTCMTAFFALRETAPYDGIVPATASELAFAVPQRKRAQRGLSASHSYSCGAPEGKAAIVRIGHFSLRMGRPVQWRNCLWVNHSEHAPRWRKACWTGRFELCPVAARAPRMLVFPVSEAIGTICCRSLWGCWAQRPDSITRRV
ncbi:hypothetical protein IWZ03DRAFT_365913 [Phyllosticta citriasiana]|uniref:Uncharacterized protein n=1 Tax=Phyllosticta citriasiana TaxID=595635 RepID=A0ABR1KYJ2_9PEZI